MIILISLRGENMTNIEHLIEYINNTPNWKEALLEEPFNLKSIEESPTHPNYWMFVYNLYNSDFTNPMLKACRGTVLEIVDNKVVGVVCHAMDKFFNYGDPNCDKIDWNTVEIIDKKDGQLIKVSRYKNEVLWFTNGAFGLNTPLSYTDDKIKDYETLVKVALGENITWIDRIPEGMTVFMELCSPYNRIVCKYDEIKMWLLGARDANQKEIPPEDLNIPLESPEIYRNISGILGPDLEDSFDGVKKLLTYFNWKTQEGVVIRDDQFNRVKMKCEDYVRIHLLIGDDGLNDNKIFNAILTNNIDDLIEIDNSIVNRVEEMKNEIRRCKIKLKWMFDEAKNKFSEFNNNRKEFAIWAQTTMERNTWFKALDNKSYNEYFESFLKDCQKRSKPYDYFKNAADLLIYDVN